MTSCYEASDGSSADLRTPRVSIIMSVFNSEATLRDAIDSIISQTFTDWELIVCDDGSTDATPDILDTVAKELGPKITILHNASNQRLSYSLNRCLDTVHGEYIARMDADDLCVPNRLHEQVTFLDGHPSVDVVGTAMQRFNLDGLADIVRVPAHPSPSDLRWGAPFAHATIMMRATTYRELGYLVSRRTERGQDYDLWFRFFAKGFSGANLSEPLYWVREDLHAIRRRTARTRYGSWLTAMIGMHSLGAPPSWYVPPTLSLMKVFVPSKAVMIYRSAQARRAEGAAR